MHGFIICGDAWHETGGSQTYGGKPEGIMRHGCKCATRLSMDGSISNVVTISWPCVTFSHAGGQQGWSQTTIEIFRTTVKQAERIGASFLLLENVPPVWTDWSWRATLLGELANGMVIMS